MKSKIVTLGMSASLCQVTHLLLYEKRIDNNNIQESTWNFFSNQTTHGWYSAVPALYNHVIKRKAEIS